MTQQNRTKFLNRTLAALLALTLILPLAACGSEETPPAGDPTPTPTPETIENFYTFADGMTVTRRPSERDPYRTEYVLPNGIPLLETGGSIPPSDAELEGVGKLSDLGDEAQAAIRAYYDEQGLLYDLNAELERVYGEYIAANYNREDTSWGDCLLTQDTQPTGGDRDTIFFTTCVSRPHVTAGTTDTTDELITDYIVEEHTTAFRKSDGMVITPDIEGVYTLSDGTRVDLWSTEYIDCIYKLPNGIELIIDSYFEPETYLSGISPDTVSETAYDAIYAYFDEQGQIYDIEAELEKVYAEYLTAGDWQPYGTYQTTGYLSTSERVIYYDTTVALPLGGGASYGQRFSVAFDRETGEVIDYADLFTVPADELADKLLARSGLTDTVLLADMDAAFSFDYLSFGNRELLVEYPIGVFSDTRSYGFAVPFTDLTDVVHDWALPQ